jgi:hypothetical protein
VRSYGTHTCRICARRVSSNGLAKTSHYRGHARRGEAVEMTNGYRTVFFHPIKDAEGIRHKQRIGYRRRSKW